MNKLISIILLLFSLPACGQTLSKINKDKDRIDKICDSIVQKFATGNFLQAYEILKQNTVLQPSTVDSLEELTNNQIQNILPRFGQMLSSEFILERKVKDFISKRFYIVKFSKSFLKVDITIYNSSTGWTINEFHYNSDVDELLQ